MANESFFNGVLNLGKIPIQNLVRITSEGSAIATTPSKIEVPLIYDEDSFSVKARSSFGGIGDPKSNTLMTLLSGATNGKIPSGQFALQNVQIWQSTDPLDISLSVKVEMLDDGYNDVVYPIKQLMKLCLPVISDSGLSRKLGMLIPPGPSLQDILTLSQSERDAKSENDIISQGNLVNVSVGKFNFQNCIVTEVSPDFSTTVDENGYPISASVTIEIKTCMVATKNMIDNMVTYENNIV